MTTELLNHKTVYTHDQFIRTAMSDIRVAREFFSKHLPEKIFQVIDLNSLRLQPRSHINDVRKESANAI
jgi:predicted transposase YdaD